MDARAHSDRPGGSRSSLKLQIPPPKPPFDWELARDLRQQGVTNVQIACRLGCTSRAVRATLAAHGVPPVERSLKTARQWGVQLYGHWKSIRSRCSYPKDHLYPRYGGRGIRVCPAWSEFEQFHAWAIERGYRPGANIVLRPRAKEFSPSTCSWVSPSERLQLLGAKPGRKSSLLIDGFGKQKTALVWANDRCCKVTAPVLRRRLRLGWLPQEAITLPPGSSPSTRRDPPAKVPYRRLDWDEIVRLHQQGRTPHEIAEKLGSQSHTIKAGLQQRRKLVSPGPGLPHRDNLRRVWNQMLENSRAAGGSPRLRVLKEWRRFDAFHGWAIESGYEAGLCLVRKGASECYSPRSCSWVKRAELVRPPRMRVRAFGEVKGPTAWARDPRCAVSATTLLVRLRAGWSPMLAITTPPAVKSAPYRSMRLVKAFGVTKPVIDWSRDRRCKVTYRALLARLSRGLTAETAITAPHNSAALGRAR